MAVFIMLLLQAATAQPLVPRSDLHESTDLAPHYLRPRILPNRNCSSEIEGEIVVCGSRGGAERYRLRPLDSDYETSPGKAETGLGDGITGKIYVDQTELPNGMISKRLMVGVKIKF